MKTHTKSDATCKLDRPLWVYSSGRSDACSICDMRLGKIHTPSHTHTHTQEFTLETRDSHGTPLRWIFRSRAIAGITGQPQVDNLALTTENKTNKQDGTEMQIQSGYGEVYWQPQNGTRRRASGLRKKKKNKNIITNEWWYDVRREGLKWRQYMFGHHALLCNTQTTERSASRANFLDFNGGRKCVSLPLGYVVAAAAIAVSTIVVH